ncbi:hypothetical protein M514_15493 [Trichuris suis]|uniref:Uncharacterized protein n=1 Tax=Trichuris suis TaxID=68888 RepID=A0A085NRX4_9BILA|nr:hypothetical protein M514_15493 [Trichuris suis]
MPGTLPGNPFCRAGFPGSEKHKYAISRLGQPQGGKKSFMEQRNELDEYLDENRAALLCLTSFIRERRIAIRKLCGNDEGFFGDKGLGNDDDDVAAGKEKLGTFQRWSLSVGGKC